MAGKMINSYRNFLNQNSDQFQNWVNTRYFQLSIFNIFVLILVLLRSAGYFEPFFLITINTIVLLGLVMAVFLLGVRSKLMFSVALVFWIFASLMKTLKIDVWAERTSIYFFQALIIGVALLVIESIDFSQVNFSSQLVRLRELLTRNKWTKPI